MADSKEESREESPLPPLPKEREVNQHAITSFLMKITVKPKGKGEEQVAAKDTKEKARQERIEVGKTSQAEPSPINETEEEHIPLRKRTF